MDIIKKQIRNGVDKNDLTSTIKLSEWSPVMTTDYVSMLFIASRRSGKTELCKYILKESKMIDDYDYTVVMSESQDTLDSFSDIVSGDLFFDKFDPQIIDNLIAVSEKQEVDGKKKSFLLIIDDIVNNDMKHAEVMKKTFCIGRHYSISVIIISQKMSLISTTSRNNADLIFIGKSNSSAERIAIIDNLLLGLRDTDGSGSQLSDRKFYFDIIKKYTANYNFIVLDNTTMSNEF